MHENEIGTVTVDGAAHLHQDLGPGLLETVYARFPLQSTGSCESFSVAACLREMQKKTEQIAGHAPRRQYKLVEA